MSSNLKRGPLDSFFTTQEAQKKSKTNVDNAVVDRFVLQHNEENDDHVIQCDPEILETHKSWPMLWTNEQVAEFQKKNPWIDCKNGKLGCSTCVKAEPGEKEITEAIQNKIHKGVNITVTKSGGINRLQFLQNIVDRMRQRLFNDLNNSTTLPDLKVIEEVFKIETDEIEEKKKLKECHADLGYLNLKV